MERAVANTIRAAAPIDPEIVTNLRRLLEEVDPMLNARRVRFLEVKKTAEEDDIFPELLKIINQLTAKSSAFKIDLAHFEPLFQDELKKKYSGFKKLAEDEYETQNELLTAIDETNKAFVAFKKSNPGWDRREMALRNLHEAYARYKDVLIDLRSAIKVREKHSCLGHDQYARNADISLGGWPLTGQSLLFLLTLNIVLRFS